MLEEAEEPRFSIENAIEPEGRNHSKREFPKRVGGEHLVAPLFLAQEGSEVSYDDGQDNKQKRGVKRQVVLHPPCVVLHVLKALDLWKPFGMNGILRIVSQFFDFLLIDSIVGI